MGETSAKIYLGDLFLMHFECLLSMYCHFIDISERSENFYAIIPDNSCVAHHNIFVDRAAMSIVIVHDFFMPQAVAMIGSLEMDFLLKLMYNCS